MILGGVSNLSGIFGRQQTNRQLRPHSPLDELYSSTGILATLPPIMYNDVGVRNRT